MEYEEDMSEVLVVVEDFDDVFHLFDFLHSEPGNDFGSFRVINCLKPFVINGNMCRCGQCVLCRVSQRSDWSLRLDLEALSTVDNAFATLTYDPSCVPFELDMRDLQLFLKRFRKSLDYPVRYFASGEYGSHGTLRPHWHLVFFGLKIKDYSKIAEVWHNGFVSASCLSSARTKYVCGYVQKKLHFFDVPLEVKSCYRSTSFLERCQKFPTVPFFKLRRQPFAMMSRMPGLGYDYLVDHKERLNDSMAVFLRGKKYFLPRFYRKKLAEIYPDFQDRFSAVCDEQANEKVIKFFSRFPDGSFFDYLNREESKVRQRAKTLLARDEIYNNERRFKANYV